MVRKWYMLAFYWQCAFWLIIAAVIYCVYDMKSAQSALLGGLAYSVPVLLTTLYTSRPARSNSLSVVADVYTGTIYQLMMAAGILVYIFKETDFIPEFVIAVFCLGAVVQYVTSFVFINREK